ncbi:MAG: zinc ribbon domain-containing protein [Chloroflexota bacterium]|nr:zinc ribbon domain-containing protein [Chloroflexota bacterium]
MVITQEQAASSERLAYTVQQAAEALGVRRQFLYRALAEGTYPQVVDPALFARVQARLAGNRAESQRPDRDPHTAVLRRGFAVCGYCGHRLSVKVNRGTERYECDRVNRRRHGCPGPSISARMLDEAIWRGVSMVLNQPGILERYLTAQRTTDPTAGALPALETRLTALDRRLANLRRRLADEDDDAIAAEYRAGIKEALGERTEAEAQQARLLAARADWQTSEARVADAVTFVADVRDQLTAGGAETWELRREVLRRLAVRVKLFGTDETHRWVMDLCVSDQAGVREAAHHYWGGQDMAVDLATYQRLPVQVANVLPSPIGW